MLEYLIAFSVNQNPDLSSLSVKGEEMIEVTCKNVSGEISLIEDSQETTLQMVANGEASWVIYTRDGTIPGGKIRRVPLSDATRIGASYLVAVARSAEAGRCTFKSYFVESAR